MHQQSAFEGIIQTEKAAGVGLRQPIVLAGTPGSNLLITAPDR